MKRIVLEPTILKSWKDFHDGFSRAMGFPDFYGKNMSAWIDCMSSIDAAEDGMSTITVEPNEILVLQVTLGTTASAETAEVIVELCQCTAFVNRRFAEDGTQTRIFLEFI
ncbi:MAG: barstar family protein [Alphaproteobacteria bacterium]|nr:barstar family protein [Alphaproteobacteria bacterium]